MERVTMRTVCALLALVWCVVGCSAPDENVYDDWREAEQEQAEDAGLIRTGQVAQAITFANGEFHGLVNGSTNSRCTHGQAAPVNYNTTNPCIFPPRRNLLFAANFGAGFSQADRNMLRDGLAFAASQANSFGWSLVVANSGGIQSSIVCNVLGTNQVGRVNFSIPTSGGTKRAWSSASITFDVCRATTLANSTGQNRDFILHTTARQMLMHVIGFGRHTESVPCDQRLMRTNALAVGCGQVGLSQNERFGLIQFDVD